jgi:hypothetical protein
MADLDHRRALVRLGCLAVAIFVLPRVEAFDFQLGGGHSFLENLFHVVIGGGFVCRRMVCSIVESTAARINILIRWASMLSSFGSGIGRVRISRLQSRALSRSHASFSPGDIEFHVGTADWGCNSLGIAGILS